MRSLKVTMVCNFIALSKNDVSFNYSSTDFIHNLLVFYSRVHRTSQ
jgi:hypothetical protein